MSEREGLQENERAARDAGDAGDDDAERVSEAAVLPSSPARQGRFTRRVRETLREFDARPRPSKPAA